MKMKFCIVEKFIFACIFCQLQFLGRKLVLAGHTQEKNKESDKKKTAINVAAYINNLSIIVFVLFFVKKSIQKPEKVSVYFETGKHKISPHSGILSWV